MRGSEGQFEDTQMLSSVSQAAHAPKSAIQKCENVALLMCDSWRMRRQATRTDGEVICPLYPKHIRFRSSKTLVDGTITLSRNVRYGITQSRGAISQKNAEVRGTTGKAF